MGIQVLSSQAEHEVITSDPRDLEEKRRKKAMGIEDNRSIEELAQIFSPPTLQQPAVQSNSVTKQLSMIQKAAEKRQEERVQIEQERQKYEEEIRKNLEEQEKERNPQKYQHTRTLQDDIDENTIPGQVVKNRKDLQEGVQHITPQGLVNFSDDENYGQQSNNS